MFKVYSGAHFSQIMPCFIPFFYMNDMAQCSQCSAFTSVAENYIGVEDKKIGSCKCMVYKLPEKHSKILQNFERSPSRYVEVLEERERIPTPVTRRALTSDLIIHPPADGIFTATLELKKQLDMGKNKLVVRVSDEMIEIFFTKKRGMDPDAANEDLLPKQKRRNPKWFSRLSRLTRSKKNNDEKSIANCRNIGRESLNENELIPHGYVSLPNFIITETLMLSLNERGDMIIQARIKGTIITSYTFRKRALTM